MSVPMRKLPTEVEIKLGKKMIHYSNIPKSKIRPLLVLLKDYQDETVPWREAAKGRIKNSQNESAYMFRVSREKAGMTQEELALKLEMPQGNISQIESGKRGIGKTLAKKLSKIFHLDYRVFL